MAARPSARWRPCRRGGSTSRACGLKMERSVPALLHAALLQSLLLRQSYKARMSACGILAADAYAAGGVKVHAPCLLLQAPLLAQQAPAACYVCQLADTPGRFLPDKAAALGVPKGPLFGRLKAGQPVQAVDGRTIQPDEARGHANLPCVGPQLWPKCTLFRQKLAYCLGFRQLRLWMPMIVC